MMLIGYLGFGEFYDIKLLINPGYRVESQLFSLLPKLLNYNFLKLYTYSIFILGKSSIAGL